VQRQLPRPRTSIWQRGRSIQNKARLEILETIAIQAWLSSTKDWLFKPSRRYHKILQIALHDKKQTYLFLHH